MDRSQIEIRDIGEKGRGLFALKRFSKGDIIFQEDPIVSCQFAWNEDNGYKACHHCLRPLETAEENAQRLAMNESIRLPYPEQCTVDKSKHVSCNFCYVRYCSSECQVLAWNKYHKTLCTQKHEPDYSHPLEELKQKWKEMHHPPETTTFMLYVRILAVIHQAEDKGAASDEILRLSFTPEKGVEQSLSYMNRNYYNHMTHLSEILDDYNIGDGLPVLRWRTLLGWSRLMGLIGRNGQGIGTSSVGDWVRNVEKLKLGGKEADFMRKFLDRLYSKFDDAVGVFLINEGVGLYATQSAINHSCRPNAEIIFPNSNHRLAVRCVRDIAPGDEICTSYLDDFALRKNKSSRQSVLLKDYFFTCECERCAEERYDGDETSEEEEEDNNLLVRPSHSSYYDDDDDDDDDIEKEVEVRYQNDDALLGRYDMTNHNYLWLEYGRDDDDDDDEYDDDDDDYDDDDDDD